MITPTLAVGTTPALLSVRDICKYPKKQGVGDEKELPNSRMLMPPHYVSYFSVFLHSPKPHGPHTAPGHGHAECAALGHPAPQIAWQKDGGTDFPAAREAHARDA